MAIEYGPHVLTRGVKQEVVCTFETVAKVYKAHGLLAIVTSVTDRSHSRASLHYTGNAYDVYWDESWEVNPQILKEQIYQKLNGFPKAADIPPDYDVVFEHDHFHIEYQPKVPPEVYTRLVKEWLDS
jgi:hypothetical protein